eukprot:CAMPEP_0168328118 /NCGR_PEP_ID=MMETSP0213-20121227/6291_1 /TAXON_ID=151035 /ORGANISM="Euplotes harpa, Strain FSP1.4" /LENGTH=139 /DNA_ID=CAMNT_0008331129 /DNA_START=414 /DNA_END=833 /DNA_ORIENTATION=+
MGIVQDEEPEPFVPYDDINVANGRKRSRGLTFAENEELIKYQKRLGIATKFISQSAAPGYPQLNKPITAPGANPVWRSASSGVAGYPSNPPPIGANYSYAGASAGNISSSQPVNPKTEERNSKNLSERTSGIKRWFGFS